MRECVKWIDDSLPIFKCRPFPQEHPGYTRGKRKVGENHEVTYNFTVGKKKRNIGNGGRGDMQDDKRPIVYGGS